MKVPLVGHAAVALSPLKLHPSMLNPTSRHISCFSPLKDADPGEKKKLYVCLSQGYTQQPTTLNPTSHTVGNQSLELSLDHCIWSWKCSPPEKPKV